MTWCVPCYEEKRAVKAVGPNDEGDPACGAHGGKEMDEKRVCACGCGTELPPNKKGGYCWGHKNKRALRGAKPASATPSNDKYADVLADLRRRKDAIERTIEVIETLGRDFMWKKENQ